MKVAFISEYFPPFAPGGAEWSTYYLSKDLQTRGIEVVVITPDYGGSKDVKEDIRVIRFPFYKKIKGIKLSEFDHLNPIWIIWASINILKISIKENPDILHIHGKYSVIPARIANIFLKKKIMATIRDYQIICNYGFCIYKKDKSCNLYEYIKGDFKEYWNLYVEHKTIINMVKNLLYAIGARIAVKILKWFTKGITTVVLSNKQGEIFKANGFRKVVVIGNSIEFKSTPSKTKIKERVVFAGRLTPGKGVNVLIDLLPDFFAMYPKTKFVFAGTGFLQKRIEKLAEAYKNIEVLGQISHHELLNLFKDSLVTVTPSIWQEPFGRIPLESLSEGTPALVSNRGGLPEIVRDKTWGRVIYPSKDKILNALQDLVDSNQIYRNNIRRDFQKIKSRFGNDVVQKYIDQYETLLNANLKRE